MICQTYSWKKHFIRPILTLYAAYRHNYNNRGQSKGVSCLDQYLHSKSSICWWTRSWSICARYSRPGGTPGMAAGGGMSCGGWGCTAGIITSHHHHLFMPTRVNKNNYAIYYLRQVNGVNGGDTVFLPRVCLCMYVSHVCACVRASVRSGPVNSKTVKAMAGRHLGLGSNRKWRHSIRRPRKPCHRTNKKLSYRLETGRQQRISL